MDKEQILAIVESLLFAAGDPLPLSRLYELVDADKKQVREALEEIQARCLQPDRGLRLVEAAGGYQFQTCPENAAWVGRLLQSKPVRLSRPSLETLSIIAYRQPVTRPEIEEVRGVDTGGVVKTLLEHDFIQIQGRKDVPGKPLIYGTTKRFLEFFRLKSLADLPTLKEMEELQEEALAGQPAPTVGEESGPVAGIESEEDREEDWEEEEEDADKESGDDREEDEDLEEEEESEE